MFKKFQDKLERLIQNQKPFLLFRKPNSIQVELWENKSLESANKFICNSFDNTKLVEFNDDEVIEISIDELPNFELSLPESDQNEAISYENYIDLIQRFNRLTFIYFSSFTPKTLRRSTTMWSSF